MKTKDCILLTELFFNKVVWDLIPDENHEPSSLLFFFKDVSFEGDLENKIAMIIVDADDGYVVNNNFKINSIEINEKEKTIYRMINKKRQSSKYWFK